MMELTLRGIVLLAAALGLSACVEVRLISDYDSYTDEHVTELQRQTETLLTSLERGAQPPQCRHANHVEVYAQMQVELELLLTRNRTRPRNELTTEQLELLSASLDDLEALHQLADAEDRCLDALEIGALRSGFGTSFGAILTLELAKRTARAPE